MFVAINNTDMDINAVEKWIKTARDANGGVISPEFAMEILGKTNHLGHIKKVLRNIKQKCTTPEKMAPYKEFILSCVDGREMSGEAMDMLKEMAGLCGCEDELETINKKDKIFGVYDCDKAVIVVCTNEDFEEDISNYKMARFEYGDKHSSLYDIRIREGAKLPKVCDFSSQTGSTDGHYISLSNNVDLANVDKLIFGKDDKVEFGVYDRIPHIKSASWSIRSYHVHNLHGKIDVSMCRLVDFSGCDFKDVEELKTENVKHLDFKYATNFFKEYHFKNNECINLSGIKFGKDTKLSFENVKFVSFSKSSFPEVLDFSGVDEVGFLSCDFSNVKEMKFKEGAKITITGNIPEDFDFSLFSDITFADCDLTNLKKLKFRDGARVRFIEDVHCDKLLDVSNCGEVYFGKTRIGREEDEEGILYDMPYLKKIKFKNITQMKKSGIVRDDRKFVFAEGVVGATAKKIASIFGGKDKD